MIAYAQQAWVDSRRYLHRPVYRLEHPDTGRNITLIGMSHVGTPKFFATVLEMVTQLQANGATVYAESRTGVAGIEAILLDPPRDSTAQEIDTLALVANHLLYHLDDIDAYPRWVTQYGPQGFDGIPRSWLQADLTVLDVARQSTGIDVWAQKFVNCTDQHAPMTNAQKADVWGRYAWYSVMLSSGWMTRAAASTILRDENILKVLDQSETDAVLPWSAAHLPNLIGGLIQRGFHARVSDVKWIRQGRIASKFRRSDWYVRNANRLLAADLDLVAASPQ